MMSQTVHGRLRTRRSSVVARCWLVTDVRQRLQWWQHRRGWHRATHRHGVCVVVRAQRRSILQRVDGGSRLSQHHATSRTEAQYRHTTSHRRTQDFTTEGVHVVGGTGQRVWGTKVPSEVQGQGPVGGLGDEIPQKLKQNVKLVYNL